MTEYAPLKLVNICQVIFPNDENWTCCKKYLKDNRHNSLHFKQIFLATNGGYFLYINYCYSDKYEGDAVKEETIDDAGAVQADPFAVESGKKGFFPEEASASHLNFFDNVHPQIPVEDMSELLGDRQPGAFEASPAKGDAMLHNSYSNPPLQEPVQADPFAMQSGQKDSYLKEAPVSHQNFFDNVKPQAPMEGMSELHGNLQHGAFPVTRAEGDVMLHHGDIEPSLQEPVQADSFAVQNGHKDSFLEEAPVSNLNLSDNEHQSQPPIEGMSGLLANLQPGALPAPPAEGDVMSHSGDLEPPLQEQYEAVPPSTVPPGVQPYIPHSVVEKPETLQNKAFSMGNVMLHHDSDLEPAPSMMQVLGFPPAIPQASVQNSEPLRVSMAPPGFATAIQQASVHHPEPSQDMAHSNNDFISHRSDLEPPLSMVPPGVSPSTQQASFQKHEPVQASMAPAVNPPSIPQASVQQPVSPQDMAFNEGDFMLRRTDLEPPPNMVPPGVPTSTPQASVQQPEPVQNMAENIPADPDHHAHVKLPSHANPLADSLGHKSSIDRPSVTLKPAAVVEPVQPPSLGKAPSEGTPVELFKPAPVEQMQLHMPPKMEGQFQPSGKQESTVDGKKMNNNLLNNHYRI